MKWLELIGIAAFAVTGATAGLSRETDIFGVLFLAVITALGGGIIRDVLLGSFPPLMFTSYVYVLLALVSALIVFMYAFLDRERFLRNLDVFDAIVNVFDAVGLGIFTVTGLDVAAAKYGMGNPLLLVLMGMTTGVGGGMLRDVLIGTIPRILRKRIYAIASLTGGAGYYLLLWCGCDKTLSAILMCLFVVALRILATVFKWNLPKVKL